MEQKVVNVDEFIQLVARLEVVEFVGLCKILCVKVVDENKEPREFETIIKEMLQSFSSTGRSQRRQIMKVLRSAQKRK